MTTETTETLAMNDLCDRFSRYLNPYNPGAAGVVPFKHEGEWYVYTTSTGDGIFAYDATDVQDYLETCDAEEEASERYNAFCDAVDTADNEALALAVLREDGHLLCAGGLCDPVAELRLETLGIEGWETEDTRSHHLSATPAEARDCAEVWLQNRDHLFDGHGVDWRVMFGALEVAKGRLTFARD